MLAFRVQKCDGLNICISKTKRTPKETGGQPTHSSLFVPPVKSGGMENYMNKQQPKIYFSDNLKKLLSAKNLTQKDFSSQTDITPSTLSGYIRGEKLPNVEFLGKIKEYIPGITVDDFLFTPLKKEDFVSESSSEASHASVDLFKYFGDYFLYYIDTTKKVTQFNSTSQEVDLRYGILYIYKSFQSIDSANCIAIFGIKRRDDLHRVKELIKQKNNDPDFVEDTFKQYNPHNVYYGKANITGHHVFITLKQQSDKFDEVHLVLHHQQMNKDYYSGGLGAASSSSTGRVSDPIVQLIALSKDPVYLSDEKIQDFLIFSRPKLNVDDSTEAKEILKLASELYEARQDSPYASLSTENKQVLLNSYLNELIKKHLESNLLWCGRVSLDADDVWYHTVKSSTEHSRKIKEKASE